MTRDIKKEVQDYYGGIARKTATEKQENCGCAPSCCGDGITNDAKPSSIFAGELPEDLLNAPLGCGNPLSLANLKPGEVVLDLGSGAGLEVFLSAKLVGNSGKAYGLDMTDDMLALANRNKEKTGLTNVEFLKGYMEDIPLEDETIDVITSNCVINLSENKEKSLEEAYRVLKKGGRLAIADIIEIREVPSAARESLQLWLGCIAGALTEDKYRRYLTQAGFEDISIEIETVYSIEKVKEMAEKKDLTHLYDQCKEEDLDGSFASAYVKAKK